jgi:hypothetical protein
MKGIVLKAGPGSMTSIRPLALLLIAVLASPGCFNLGEGAYPLVFPNEGRSGGTPAGDPDDWGTTVAMMIDSNYLPWVDADEWHDIHPDQIEIWIQDAENPTPLFEVEAKVRSVFELAPDAWSALRQLQPGVTGTVVLFDLPPHSQLGFGEEIEENVYPRDVSVIVKVEGLVRPTVLVPREAPLTLTGWDGASQQLMYSGFWPGQETLLQKTQHSMVRLRGKRNAFEEAQVIGSIEFDFENLGCNAQVQGAQVRSEANGIVVVRDLDYVTDRQRVMVISPSGFQLPHLDTGVLDDKLAGQGPFLDLMIQENLPCDLTVPGWFTIHNLTVTDLDGQVIDPAGLPPLDGLDPVEVDYPDAPSDSAVFRAYLVDPTPAS